MNVIFDVDGVIADCVSSVLDKLNANFDTAYKREDIVSFDFMKPKTGIMPLEHCRFAKNVFAESGFAALLDPIDNALATVRHFIDSPRVGRVMFVTSQWYSSKTWCYDRHQWLRSNFGCENVDKNLFFTHDKSAIPADVFIDDKPENCIRYKQHNEKSVVLLFDQPWNRHVGQTVAVDKVDTSKSVNFKSHDGRICGGWPENDWDREDLIESIAGTHRRQLLGPLGSIGL